LKELTATRKRHRHILGAWLHRYWNLTLHSALFWWKHVVQRENATNRALVHYREVR
jgi:hypothetical protein